MSMLTLSQISTKLVFIVCSLVAITYYYAAPVHYSYEFNYSLFIVFCIEAGLLLIQRCRRSILNFEFIFTLTFLFVNYIYPIVYYPINPYFSLFTYEYPEYYINKGTALATIAYSFLCLGLCKYQIISYHKLHRNAYIGDSLKSLKSITVILLLIMIVALIPIYLSGAYDMQWGVGSEIRGIMESLIFYTIFQIFYKNRNRSFKSIFINNRLYFILILTYVILSTAIGNRSNIIRICFLILILYNFFIKHLSSKIVLIFLVIGMIGLYVRGVYRSHETLEDAMSSSTAYLDIGRDLTINNRSLYVLMEYADEKGYTFGRNFLGSLLSPIPYAQSTLLYLTGWDKGEISSGNRVTYEYFDYHPNQNLFGLGTNLVGDVYLAFGLMGVIVLFYILGIIISKIYHKALSGWPLYIYIYSIIIINAVIWTRSDFLKPLQMILWGIALYLIFDKKIIKFK